MSEPGVAPPHATPPPATGLAPRLLPHLEGLDDVADLQVVEVAERQTTLEALADLDRVVLEPPQRADRLVLHDNDVVAEQPGAGVAADLPAEHHAARDGADLRGTEDVA